jgi:hypothetical protein
VGYTCGDLLNDVWRKLQFHDRFDRGMRLAGLNRAVEKVILYASQDDQIMKITPPADPTNPGMTAREFPLPPEVLKVSSVSWDGQPLKQATQAEYVQTFNWMWQTFATCPSWYYIRDSAFLALAPQASVPKTVYLWGVFKPADMVADTDPVPLLRQYSDALIAYAAWWCTDGLKGEEEVARNQAFMQEYLGWRSEAKLNYSQNSLYKINRVR